LKKNFHFSLFFHPQRIQDVRIDYPAGGCCPPNVLTTVHVQTAGAGSATAEVVLTGLLDPDHFRRALLAWRAGEALPVPKDDKAAKLYEAGSGKTAQHLSGDDDEPAPSARKAKKGSSSTITRSVRDGAADDASLQAQLDTVALLKEMNGELKALRKVLEKQQA